MTVIEEIVLKSAQEWYGRGVLLEAPETAYTKSLRAALRDLLDRCMAEVDALPLLHLDERRRDAEAMMLKLVKARLARLGESGERAADKNESRWGGATGVEEP